MDVAAMIPRSRGRHGGLRWAVSALWLMASAVAKPPVFRFATAEEGQARLRHRDDFIQRLSAFDRSARLKSNEAVDEARFLDFVAAQVLDWSGSSRATMSAAISELAPQWVSLDLPWPEPVWLIRTTGREEGRAAYTRGTGIVFPEAVVEMGTLPLADRLAHELFHVLSRANPRLRKTLYAAIGFESCAEVQFPPELAPRRITNPDAPAFDQAITVRVDGRERRVVPVLHATVDRYPAGDRREFFSFLKFGFWPLDPTVAAGSVPVLIEPGEMSGFDEQVGRNTGYIIHPEEIIADNFKLLVRRSTNVTSPTVLRRIEDILRGAATRGPGQ